jgi:putative ATPase
MACAPKSNASYKAVAAAMDDVQKNRTVPVPRHLRNAPHPGMREAFGNAEGYQYSHSYPGGVSPDQDYLGVDKQYYIPTDRGYEKHIAAYLEWIEEFQNSERSTSK